MLAPTLPAQSPFLPGTNIQFAWDSTSLGMLKTCPRLYQYVMILGYGESSMSPHLRFGIEYHSVLQDYDIAKATGTKHKPAMHQAIGKLLSRITDWTPDETTRAGKYKNPTTLLSLAIDYLDHFADDPAETYILANGKPAVELSFRFELDWGPKANPAQPYLLCGHLDRVVTFSDNLFVMDRKTSMSTLSDHYFDQWSPSNQMTLYTIASQIIIGSPVKGVILDAAQVLLEKPNDFKRGITYRTPEQLEEWTNDLAYWLNTAEAYAIADYWPMNDTACGMYGGCKFRTICSKSPRTRKAYLSSDHPQLPPEERWNPLKER